MMNRRLIELWFIYSFNSGGLCKLSDYLSVNSLRFFRKYKKKIFAQKSKTKYWYFLKFGGEVRLKSKKRMKVLKLLFGAATARLGETFARADHIGMQFMTNIIWAIIWVMRYDS